MTPKYRETKNAIREALATLPTQRLADIVCFARDGGMSYWNACCCIKGVATAKVLHVAKIGKCPEGYRNYIYSHYDDAQNDLWNHAERAYAVLGVNNQQLRDRLFIPIVRAALKLRTRTEKPDRVTAEVMA